MLNYIVLVNKEKKVIIVDYKTNNKKCQPDVGYESDCDDWSTNKKEYMCDNDIFFEKDKAFKEPGIYEVIGYDNSCDTEDGFMEDYMVENIVKIAELPYTKSIINEENLLLKEWEKKNPNWSRFVYVVNDDYVKEEYRRKDWGSTRYCRTSVYPLPNESVESFFSGEDVCLMDVAYDEELIDTIYKETFEESWDEMKKFCNDNNLKILQKNLPRIEEWNK